MDYYTRRKNMGLYSFNRVKNINKMSEQDKPRNKMLNNNPAHLNNVELLALILGGGIKGRNVLSMAKDVLNVVDDNIGELTLEKIQLIDGIGKAKACQILAAIEFGKRLFTNEKIRILSLIHI